MAPLRRDFEATKAAIEIVLSSGKKWTPKTPLISNPIKIFDAFLGRLRSIRVLDPACGTGGFLLAAYESITKNHLLDPDEKRHLSHEALKG